MANFEKQRDVTVLPATVSTAGSRHSPVAVAWAAPRDEIDLLALQSIYDYPRQNWGAEQEYIYLKDLWGNSRKTSSARLAIDCGRTG